MTRLLPFLFAALLLAAGCAGPREARTPEAGEAEVKPPPKSAPTTRTVDGFRIQILNTPERAAAYEAVESAMDWWASLPSSRRHRYLGGNELDAEVKWRQPTYRVHVGRFATRAEAEEALRTVRARFPDAFLVPERVTVTR